MASSSPPPPPGCPLSPRAAASSDAARRLPFRRLLPARALPALTTSLGSQPAPLHTTTAHTPSSVISAPTLSVPFSPYAVASSPVTAATPRPPVNPMAMRPAPAVVAPYNPQDWGSRAGTRPVAGSYVPYASSPVVQHARSEEITGMEAANMPSPPPPYSPSAAHTPQTLSAPMAGHAFAPNQTLAPHLQHPAIHDVASPVPSAASPAAMSPFDHQRFNVFSHDSPTASSPHAFPPPPSGSRRDRSLSRNRPDGRSLLSGLSVLAGRNRAGSEQAPQQQPNAIDSLRLNTNEALTRTAPPAVPQMYEHGPSSSRDANGGRNTMVSPSAYMSPISASGDPPAARRAASTGTIGSGSRRSPDHLATPGGWQPGMLIPGPPPGPPPSSLRSQSLSRTSDRSYPSSRESGTPVTGVAAPPTRRPPQRGTQLGPVPPTPADWVPNTPRNASHTRSPSAHGLTVDTSVGSHARVAEVQQEDTTSDNSGQSSQTRDSLYGQPSATASPATGLTRRPARRDSSVRGIRERRSESRAARERTVEQGVTNASEQDEASARPADLKLASPPSRQQGQNAALNPPYADRDSKESMASRPLQAKHRTTGSSTLSDTPPITPVIDPASRRNSNGKSPAIPPVALPTPPQRSGEEYFRPNAHSSARPSSSRAPSFPPSDEQPPPTGTGSKQKPTEPEAFMASSIDRHRAFVEKEAAAKDDRERLELFAEFIVAESRLRRDRYSAAFDAIAGEVFDLTRDLWRSYGGVRRSATPLATPASVAEGANLTRTTTASSLDSHRVGSSPDDYSANYTPRTDMESPASVTSQGAGRGDEGPRGGAFKPSLSPIPSMAMSTAPDEEDSRGRKSSRWWEESIENESIGQGGRRPIERSKRESKYMGVPVEHLIRLENAAASPGTPHTGDTPGPSGACPPTYYGSNDYPAEKASLDDTQQQLTPQHYPYWNHSAPATPDPYKLDVSRLVTLPPPYPRHHPALNNSHPDLAAVRTSHRTLADLAEVYDIKTTFATKLAELRDEQQADAAARRDRVRLNIQSQIQSGSMSYADAAAAEKSFEANEPRRLRDALQAQFDAYQADVMTPLHAILSERITKCGAAIEHLKAAIEASRESANQAQEEGDEKPELLEKLTLLKWLFEARETLHRELFIADSQRCEMYKVLVVLPYRQAGNEDKAAGAEQFFAQDDLERKIAFEKDVQKRTERLMDIVEEHVTRGVEDLLGAFWDIAPGLLAVVQKIPDDLDGSQGAPEILIPPGEYDENPSYVEHPLQYLYTLLAHAEKSAYQFIESQTNLLCLLHEVKTAVMAAGSRVMEGERVGAGEAAAAASAEMADVRKSEEARLTSDLKDRVGLVEGQWREGLGDALGRCRARVEAYLVRTGGWDESLQE